MNSKNKKVKEIVKYLVFLNMDQLKSICSSYGIYYNIFIERNNNVIKTSEVDQKKNN